MLKIVCDKSGIEVMGSGTGLNILVDLIAAINRLYSTLHKRSPDYARVFREQLVSALNDPECPVWDPTSVDHALLIEVPHTEEADQ